MLRFARFPRLAGLLAPLFVAGLLGAALAPAALAANHNRVPPAYTSLTLEVPSSAVLGSNVTVIALLRDGAGRALGDLHINLLVNGTQVTSDRTDPSGRGSMIIRTKTIAAAKSYTIDANFPGTTLFAPSFAHASLKVLPAAVQIRTTPAVTGMKFTLGSDVELTGPDGIAAFPVPVPGSYPVTVDLNPPNAPDPSMRASFVRWVDDIYTPNRTIQVKGPDILDIGLRVAYRASVRYVDLNNQPVDPSLVNETRFSSGTGTDDIVINGQVGADEVWWTSATAIRRGNGLQISPVTYRLLSAKMDGAEVVNRGQQAWTPTENGVWTIQLLLYGMTVHVQDVLFGWNVSGPLDLVYPNGAVHTASLDSNGNVSFSNLPRGTYQVKLKSSSITPPTTVALSRPQTATMRVITYVDIALVVGVFLAAMILLAILGRRSGHVRRGLGRVFRVPGRTIRSGRSGVSSLATRIRRRGKAAGAPSA